MPLLFQASSVGYGWALFMGVSSIIRVRPWSMSLRFLESRVVDILWISMSTPLMNREACLMVSSVLASG